MTVRRWGLISLAGCMTVAWACSAASTTSPDRSSAVSEVDSLRMQLADGTRRSGCRRRK